MPNWTQFVPVRKCDNCGRETVLESILCPECIQTIWPVCTTPDPDIIIAYKGLTDNGDGVYRGNRKAPYKVGKPFATIGTNWFMISPLGPTKDGHGAVDGVFLLKLSESKLNDRSTIETYSPVLLLEVRARKYFRDEVTRLLADPVSLELQKIEAEAYPELPKQLSLPTDEQFDEQVGYRYSALKSPVHPFFLPSKKFTDRHRELFFQWKEIHDQLSLGSGNWRSTRDYIRDQITVSIGVWINEWIPPKDNRHPLHTFLTSVGAAITGSLGSGNIAIPTGSMDAYLLSHFPNIHGEQFGFAEDVDLFQPAVDLWHEGFVPSYDGETWRLHASNGDGTCVVAWEGRI